ncbi:hypothetical protein AAFN85_28000 [Mucilaginibacter sp. CAU 1740]|uniref:hypothetical protein n=1 Tax=Mucilaginibacter sp. CAU 1740 TaxID=3140365 RepID=UPI00325A8896
MNNGCKIRPEWVPEAYKSNDGAESNNHAQTDASQSQALPHNSLYGYHKKYPARQRYSKK